MLNILLSLLFFARFGQILISTLIASEKPIALAIVFQAFTPLYFAAPACFYLYISGFIHNRDHLLKRQWLHFLPALLALIHIIPWQGQFNLDWNTMFKQLAENGYFSLKIRTGVFQPAFHYALRPILILGYLCMAWISLIRKKTDQTSTTDKTGRQWIVFFLRIATFFQLLSLLPVILRGLHIPYTQTSFVVLNCLALLGIVLYALHKPYMFYGYLLVAVDWNKKTEPSPSHINIPIVESELHHLVQVEQAPQLAKPVKKLNLSAGQLDEFLLSMKTVMEQERLYLTHDFQIVDLAGKINIPVHHCSYIINNLIGKNFRDWINGYRVDYFLNQYPIKSDKLTIEAIAYESGFKNLATFYNAFKKEKGAMPTHYFNKELS
ncbi:helix-turn-helix domain-containing protein [Pedobacter sp. GSP4]|uniref:helix-turn-helix domain-containing protein n=1 Tax=Pedobacter sp. GSP4 TaxID=3453716 RepID=UPI003EEC1FA4